MKDIVKVQNHNVTVIEWNNERVITTAQLAELYETNTDNIKKNLDKNRDRFIKGKHYYVLKGEELQEFKNLVTDSYQVDKRTPQLYLWTKRGASRHCKILGTDRSWDVFDCLEESYFNPNTPGISSLSPQLQVLINLEHKQKQQEQEIKQTNGKIEAVNADLQEFKQDIPLLGVEEIKVSNAVKKKGVDCLGGKQSAAYGDNSIRGKVYADIHRQLKREFGVTTYKAIKRRECDLAIGVVEAYELPRVLQEEINAANRQIIM